MIVLKSKIFYNHIFKWHALGLWNPSSIVELEMKHLNKEAVSVGDKDKCLCYTSHYYFLIHMLCT